MKPDQLNGAIYGVLAPTRSAAKPIGEWNAMRIVAVGRTVRVELNGVEVVNADMDKYRAKAKEYPGLERASGRIGLQSSDTPVEFRNIEIKELPAKPNLADLFQAGSVWVGKQAGADQVLTVLERKGEQFKARFVIGDGIDRTVSGTAKEGKVSWLTKDVKVVKGGYGGDNQGTFGEDTDGPVLHFTWQIGGTAGKFDLRPKAAK